jgi:hypothetical protein
MGEQHLDQSEPVPHCPRYCLRTDFLSVREITWRPGPQEPQRSLPMRFFEPDRLCAYLPRDAHPMGDGPAGSIKSDQETL